LSSLPHIERCMEKSLEAVLDWAEVIVVTQEATSLARETIARYDIPVINVTRSSDGGPIAKMAGV
jgi:hypothetical protein